ncbi:hypothetical protein [Kaistella sp.]|uniref:hypothetical protein n=1 Tax=Kaistella sp. TaxID=2782235 RepID=UPI003C60B83C
MDIYQVKITGFGKKNNQTVNIEKIFEVDLDEYKKAKTANDFRGQALEEYVNRAVPYHYPGITPTNCHTHNYNDKNSFINKSTIRLW